MRWTTLSLAFIALASIAGSPALAIPEDQVLQVYTAEKLRTMKNEHFRTYVGEQNSRIGYLTFRDPKGHRGTVLIAAGRAESSMKFVELASDLLRKGFSLVYVLDQRGQGLSDRLIPGEKNFDKTHIDKMDYVVRDLEKFIATVMTRESKGPYYLVGNITAAVPATLYLQENRDQPFSKAYFTAPLYELHASLWEKLVFYMRSLFLAPTDYALSDEQEYAPKPFGENDRTYSENRYALADRVVRAIPEGRSYGSTINWAEEVLKGEKRIMKHQGKIAVPTRMVHALEDEHTENAMVKATCKDKFVDCKDLPLFRSKHWILFEKDHVRDRAIRHMSEFFK